MRANDVSLSDQIVASPRQLEIHASLRILVKDIAAILEKHFPEWMWMIEPDQKGQVINIFNNHLHNEWGYTIRTIEIHNDPKRRLAYRAGREILERFGMEPRGIRPQIGTLEKAPRDSHGRVMPVHVWDRMTRQQKEKQAIAETKGSIEDTIKRLMADG